MSAETVRHYTERFEAFRAQRGVVDPPWLVALRDNAAQVFAERGFPTRRDEEWRYTNLAPLTKAGFELPPEGRGRATRDDVESLSIPVFACTLFVFVDGHYAPELSTPPALAREVTVESLATLLAEAPERIEPHLGHLLDTKVHPFAALNTAFFDDGAVLLVPDGAQLESPMHVVFLTTDAGSPAVQHPRVLIAAGAGSRATLIQDHVSLGGTAGFTNAATEVKVGRNARVDLVNLQRESDERFHVSSCAARIERDGRFASHVVSVGGRLVRNDLSALLAGEGADCTLNGLFVATGRQLIDNHTTVDHAMPHGTSRELYKGVLADASRGVFRGRVVVRPDAQKTDATQSNPNLLLSDRAEIDTKPQLEIHADDVKCSHGSAIGQLDRDALFYLRARAIDESAARALLTRAFAAEAAADIPVAPLRDEIGVLIEEKLRS